MKQLRRSTAPFLIAASLLVPGLVHAQNEGNKNPEKPKEKERIIITENADSKGKIVVEINGDNITVNGKPIAEYKMNDSSLTVHIQKYKDMEGMMKERMGQMKEKMKGMPGVQPFTYNYNYNGDAFSIHSDGNHAQLGVVTEKNDKGVLVQEVTKESAAEKAGLKQNDIISKVDDEKISSPDDLMNTIQKHKPGDKVSITYWRDNKEQKTTAELKKSMMTIYGVPTPGADFNFNDKVFRFDENQFNKQWQDQLHNQLLRIPRNMNQGWYTNEHPKLGLSVQDTDDGKGVKVIDVDDESNAAKAGIKQDDVITEMDGKAVNSADEAAKIIRDSRDKKTIMVKLTRGGKSQNIEVKIPHNLKSADL